MDKFRQVSMPETIRTIKSLNVNVLELTDPKCSQKVCQPNSSYVLSRYAVYRMAKRPPIRFCLGLMPSASYEGMSSTVLYGYGCGGSQQYHKHRSLLECYSAVLAAPEPAQATFAAASLLSDIA